MKITDIYLVSETLDAPLNYQQIGNGRYIIDVADNNKLIVSVITREVQNLKLMSVLFRDPNSEQTKLTNLFKEINPIRVFSTILKIVSSIPNVDIIMFMPDDIEIAIEHKKLRLYQLIVSRMVKQNKLISSGTLDINGLSVIYGILPTSQANYLTDEQIKSIAIDFGIEKQT